VRYREFVTFGTVSALIDTAAQHALVLLSAALAGPAAAGPIVVVQRVAGAVFGLLSANLADVWHGEAARLRDASPRELVRQVRRRGAHLLAVGIAIFVPMAVVGRYASTWVFGAQWASAGTVLVALTPTFVAAFAVNPLSRTLLVLERMRIKLAFDVASLLLPAGAYLVAHRLGRGVDAQVLAFSIASAAVYAGYYLIILRACVDFARAEPDRAASATEARACERSASK
jgi:O-antigen/teichoic acid export membrane protein